MGLNAINCENVLEPKTAKSGECARASSDFSGTDLLKGAALTAAMVLAAGCVDKSNSDDGPMEPPQANPHGTYPFDISATPEERCNENSLCSFRFNNTETVGNVRGFHSSATNANYWIEFKGVGSDAHYNYDIYRVEPSGAVEKTSIALENYEGRAGLYGPNGFNEKYFEEMKNPDLHDYLAVIDFKGNDKWQDLKLVAYASITTKAGYLSPAGIERITELTIGEANVSTRFVMEQK